MVRFGGFTKGRPRRWQFLPRFHVLKVTSNSTQNKKSKSFGMIPNQMWRNPTCYCTFLKLDQYYLVKCERWILQRFQHVPRVTACLGSLAFQVSDDRQHLDHQCQAQSSHCHARALVNKSSSCKGSPRTAADPWPMRLWELHVRPWQMMISPDKPNTD